MSIGQIAEILTMFILGATLKRLGWRATMIVGILGHAARFAVYAFFPQHTGLIILVQVLHGICYAFFFATVYIFVDEYFPKDVRSSAQGLFNVMILGIGALVANSICPWLLQEVFTKNGVTDFQRALPGPAGGGLGGRGRARALLPSAGEEASGLGAGRDGGLGSAHLDDHLDLDAGPARDLGHPERAARVRPALAEDGHQQLRGPVGHEVLLRERGRAVHEHQQLDDALDALEVAEGGLQRAQEVDGDGRGPPRVPAAVARPAPELADPGLAVPLGDVAGRRKGGCRSARWARRPLPAAWARERDAGGAKSLVDGHGCSSGDAGGPIEGDGLRVAPADDDGDALPRPRLV